MAPYHSLVSGPALELLLEQPASPPPPGQVNDLNAANWFYAANYVCLVVFMVVNTSALLLRLFTQHFVLKGLVLEDYVAVIAWIFQVGENVTGFICIKRGAGKHVWDLTIREAISVKQSANWVGIMYGLSAWFIKLAILLQFLRIFTPGGVHKPMQIACWVWIVLNSIYYFIDTLTQVMLCLPREAIWNPFIVGGHCLSLKGIWAATGIFTVISDVAILVLPLPIIFRLQLAFKKKILLLAVFTTGGIACVASTIRTYYTFRTFSTPDETYYMLYIGIWTWIEVSIGILVFCLPTTPQLFHCIKAKTASLFSSLRTTTTRSSPSASDLSRELSQTPPASVEKGARGHAKFFPYQDVSLASFEQRATRREASRIHVTRSVSVMTERTEETDESP